MKFFDFFLINISIPAHGKETTIHQVSVAQALSTQTTVQ